MAASIFVKLAGIKGESLDQKHKDEIDALSWSWGVAQTGTMAHGSGGGEGKASFNDLTFSHRIDKASPLLMKACATGQHIADAILTQRREGVAPLEFLVIRMTDVLVVSVSSGGSHEGDATFESVAIAFAKVDVEYKPQKNDGSLDAGIHFKFDPTASKAV